MVRGLVGDGVGVIKWVCELGVTVCRAHIVEWDVGRHAGSNPSGESPNLLVDVIQERVGGPAAMLLDDDAVHAVEFHGHGTASTQGMAADICSGEAESAKAKSDDGVFEVSVDVRGFDLLGLPSFIIVCADSCSSVVCVLHNVGHAAG